MTIKILVPTVFVEPLNDVMKTFIIFMVLLLYRTQTTTLNTNIRLSLEPETYKHAAVAAVVLAIGMFLANVAQSQVKFVSARVEYYKRKMKGRR